MRSIETVDVSRPRASGAAAAFARAELRRAREARHYGLTPVASVVVVVVLATAVARTQDIAPGRPSDGTDASAATLADAQREFYSGRYEAAAELSAGLCAAGAGDLGDLEACELRTSSLHFQIRRAMGTCRSASAIFAEAVATAQQLARDLPDNRELTRFVNAHQG